MASEVNSRKAAAAQAELRATLMEGYLSAEEKAKLESMQDILNKFCYEMDFGIVE